MSVFQPSLNFEQLGAVFRISMPALQPSLHVRQCVSKWVFCASSGLGFQCDVSLRTLRQTRVTLLPDSQYHQCNI
eukprot:scaffold2630_cov72-Attheya_sp.AAC.6